MEVKLKVRYILLLLIVFCIAACKNNNVYFHYHSVNPDAWNKDSIYVFDIEIPNIVSSYNIYINVRNSPDYSYQNLWLFVNEISPDESVNKDTIEFYLADHKGKWLGTGAGAIKEMPVLYKQNHIFEAPGTYIFEVGHGMRVDELKGITEIGMRVEEITD